jgi:hypothetical protein
MAHLVKGFIRLWAVLTVLVWGGVIVWLLCESGNNLYLFIAPHLLPAAALVGTSAEHINTSHAYAMTRWCIFIANPNSSPSLPMNA